MLKSKGAGRSGEILKSSIFECLWSLCASVLVGETAAQAHLAQMWPHVWTDPILCFIFALRACSKIGAPMILKDTIIEGMMAWNCEGVSRNYMSFQFCCQAFLEAFNGYWNSSKLLVPSASLSSISVYRLLWLKLLSRVCTINETLDLGIETKAPRQSNIMYLLWKESSKCK